MTTATGSIYGYWHLDDTLRPQLITCLREGTTESRIRGNSCDPRYGAMEKNYRALVESIRQVRCVDDIEAAEADLQDARAELVEIESQFQVVLQQRNRARRECERLEGESKGARQHREHFFNQNMTSLYNWNQLLFDAVEPLLVQKGFERQPGGRLEDVALKSAPPPAVETETEPPVAVRPDGRPHRWCLHCKRGDLFEEVGTRGHDELVLKCHGCGTHRTINKLQEEMYLRSQGII